MNDYGNIVMPITEVKAWEFSKDSEVDIEIWNDGNYVTTLSINYQTGKVTHQSFSADLESNVYND